jgi:hypothetical protein
MDRKKGAFLATLGLVVLLVSLALSAPGNSLASPPPGDRDVRVVNSTSEPVPVVVQGTATVSGSVSVAGVSSVAVTNNPNVTVTNTPNVSVANAPGNPVLVRDVDRAARQPYAMWVVGTMPAGQLASNAPDFTRTVPAGKVLVIETVSMRIETQADQQAIGGFGFRSGGVYNEHYLPLRVTALGGLLYHESIESVKVYADPSTDVWSYVRLNTNVSGTTVRFNFSGYLVDAP